MHVLGVPLQLRGRLPLAAGTRLKRNVVLLFSCSLAPTPLQEMVAQQRLPPAPANLPPFRSWDELGGFLDQCMVEVPCWGDQNARRRDYNRMRAFTRVAVPPQHIASQHIASQRRRTATGQQGRGAGTGGVEWGA